MMLGAQGDTLPEDAPETNSTTELPLPLQQESYHPTKQSEARGTTRVELTQEELEECETLDDALSYYAMSYGPVIYNSWQSAYFHLLSWHGYIDDDAPETETPHALQERLKAMYQQTYERIYGEDFRAQAIALRKKAGATTAEARPKATGVS